MSAAYGEIGVAVIRFGTRVEAVVDGKPRAVTPADAVASARTLEAVEAIPKSPQGKILRRVLAERLD